MAAKRRKKRKSTCFFAPFAPFCGYSFGPPCGLCYGILSKRGWKIKTARLSAKRLTIGSFRGEIVPVKITRTGQVTIPPAMRRKHGLLAQAEVELVDQPDGVLVVRAATTSRGKRVLATLLRGGKIKGRTDDWLALTRE